jgi:hypothetical protein
LEKTKYEDSDVKWKELDAKYHFSCQFTADMIAMNSADFIITSTYQEIAGRFVFYLPSLVICRPIDQYNLYCQLKNLHQFLATLGQGSMKAIRHLPCQDFAVLCQASMSLTQSSTLLPLGLTNLSTSPTPRNRSG